MRQSKSIQHGLKEISHAIKLYNILPDSLFIGSLKAFKINTSNYFLENYT